LNSEELIGVLNCHDESRGEGTDEIAVWDLSLYQAPTNVNQKAAVKSCKLMIAGHYNKGSKSCASSRQGYKCVGPSPFLRRSMGNSLGGRVKDKGH
jgi:hypothetical protein